MKIVPTEIPEVLLIEPTVFGDERGFFMETFRESFFKEAGIEASFVQDNHSASSKGVLRGLHYQTKHPQGKMVRVIAGEVFDVAVDMRINSPTDSISFVKFQNCFPSSPSTARLNPVPTGSMKTRSTTSNKEYPLSTN